MRDIFKLFGIIALAAIIGFSMIACSNGTGKGDSTTSDDSASYDGGNKAKPDGSNPGTTGNNPGTTGGDDTDPWTVTNMEEWSNAMQKIREGGNNKSYTITVKGDIPFFTRLDGIVAGYVSGAPNENVTVTLKGSGTLTGSISIMNNQTLIIDGITLNGGVGVGTNINDISKFELKSGIINGSSGPNGGVVISGNGSTFTMSGGTISNLAGVKVGFSSNNFIMTGGTITYVEVGFSSNFIMTGGTITNGSGVRLGTGTTFTMEGGTISDNSIGVEVSGNFTMAGGTISGNSPGGGVQVGGGGFFKMSGGTISGNKGVYGGGVSAGKGGFSKTGGIIYGSDADINSNIATNTGDAVCNMYTLTGINTTLDENYIISW